MIKRILPILFLLTANPTQAADITFSWGPPPVVLGCTIGGNYTAVVNCLTGQVDKQIDTAVETAVGAAAEAHEQTLANLAAQHEDALDELEAQIGQLQSQLNQAGNNAQRMSRDVQNRAAQGGRAANNAWQNSLQNLSAPLQQLQSCLVGKGVDLVALLNTDGANSISVARQRLLSVWRTVVRNARNYPTFTVDPQQPPTTTQLLQRANTLAGQMVETDPVASCMWAQTDALRQQALQVLAGLLPQILAQFNQAVDQVAKPMAQRAMGDLIRPLLRDATGLAARTAGRASHAAARAAMSQLPEDVKRQIYAMAHERILNPAEMAALIAAVNRHAVSLNNPHEVQRSLTELRAKLGVARRFSDEEAVVIGAEILRALGHETIDSPEAQAALAHGIGQVLTLGNGVDGVVNAMLGTASQPTATLTNFIVFCVEFGLNSHIAVAQWGITQASHVAWEQVMVAARQQLGSVPRGGAPSRRARRVAGPFGQLLDHFPSEADLIVYTSPQLEQMRQDLFNYHTAVLKLAEEAVPSGSNTATSSSTGRKSRVTAPAKTSPRSPRPRG